MKVHVTCPIHRDWVWSSNIEVRLPEVRSWYVKQMWTQLPEIVINTSYVCLLSGYHRTVAAIGWRPNSLVVGSWEIKLSLYVCCVRGVTRQWRITTICSGGDTTRLPVIELIITNNSNNFICIAVYTKALYRFTIKKRK